MAPKIRFWRLVRRIGKVPELLDAINTLYEHLEGLSTEGKLRRLVGRVRKAIKEIVK